MRIVMWLMLLIFLGGGFGGLGVPGSVGLVWAGNGMDGEEIDYFFDDDMEDEEVGAVCDPLEPMNRFFFHFNDKLYFWLLKPVSQGYGYVVPEPLRGCIKKAFHNLLVPIRVVNNLLQGKIKDSGIELSRFVINSTVGILGMADPASDEFDLKPSNEDLGQTLATYGMGNGFYLCWPFIGPSTARDSLGLVGDSFFNPLSYLYLSDAGAGIAAYSGRVVNCTSLTIGDYDSFIEASFDPYIAMRDAYLQYRDTKIKDRGTGAESPIAAHQQGDIPGQMFTEVDGMEYFNF